MDGKQNKICFLSIEAAGNFNSAMLPQHVTLHYLLRLMLIEANPKLPMRTKEVTKDFYLNRLGFQLFGSNDFDGYLMVCKDQVQLHFFEHKDLDPSVNYGQVYIRTTGIDRWYEMLLKHNVTIHPHGHLANKPWGQREFSLLDPDNNLLTFGEALVDS